MIYSLHDVTNTRV